MDASPADAITAQVASAVRAALEWRDDEARRLLDHVREEPRKRTSLSRAKRLAIFRRDGFCCRYCGRETLFEPALRVLSLLYDDGFPYNQNWKRGSVHPIYATHTATCDHKVPVTRGGDPISDDNLLTACARCQYSKGDYLLDELRGWEELPQQEASGWDGLTGSYPRLCERVRPPLTLGADLEAWLVLLRAT